MAKDSKGHGSEKHATAMVRDLGNRGPAHEVRLAPSKSSIAKTRGWKDAVGYHAPGFVPKVHESMSHAKAALEKHPGFAGWKAPEAKVKSSTKNGKY